MSHGDDTTNTPNRIVASSGRSVAKAAIAMHTTTPRDRRGVPSIHAPATTMASSAAGKFGITSRGEAHEPRRAEDGSGEAGGHLADGATPHPDHPRDEGDRHGEHPDTNDGEGRVPRADRSHDHGDPSRPRGGEGQRRGGGIDLGQVDGLVPREPARERRGPCQQTEEQGRRDGRSERAHRPGPYVVLDGRSSAAGSPVACVHPEGGERCIHDGSPGDSS